MEHSDQSADPIYYLQWRFIKNACISTHYIWNQANLFDHIWCHIFHTFPWRNIPIIMTIQCQSLQAKPHSVFSWYVGFFLYIRSTSSFYIEPFSWEYFYPVFLIHSAWHQKLVRLQIFLLPAVKSLSTLTRINLNSRNAIIIQFTRVNRLYFSSLLGFCWFDAVIMCKNILVINDIIIYYPTEK